MLKMCPLKNTLCVIDLGYLFELAKWISWIFVASFESTPILNQTHRLLKDLIWHLTILYINIPHFFLDRHNPPKSQHQQSLHQKNKMLLLSLCSSIGFCRSSANLDRFIFCHFLNCEQDLAGSALWKHSHKQSLHYFEGNRFSGICLSGDILWHRRMPFCSQSWLNKTKPQVSRDCYLVEIWSQI